jgi:hypothetical protein
MPWIPWREIRVRFPQFFSDSKQGPRFGYYFFLIIAYVLQKVNFLTKNDKIQEKEEDEY